jgi:hypothetical protein
MRNRRDPSWRPTSGEGDPYKPTAKGDRAGRESEGFIVPLTLVTKTPAEGRSPALVMAVYGGQREGMVARPNNPIDKVRELQHYLFTVAERSRKVRVTRVVGIWRSDVSSEA